MAVYLHSIPNGIARGSVRRTAACTIPDFASSASRASRASFSGENAPSLRHRRDSLRHRPAVCVIVGIPRGSGLHGIAAICIPNPAVMTLMT